jgi:hypothetical protein
MRSEYHCDVSITPLQYEARRTKNSIGPTSKVPFITDLFENKHALPMEHVQWKPRVMFQLPHSKARRDRRENQYQPHE